MPRYPPVTQAVIYRTATATGFFKPVSDTIEGVFIAQAVVVARVDRNTLLDEHSLINVDLGTVRGCNNLLDRQAMLLCEFPVAFVVTRYRHHSARAVTHQHEIRDPQRYFITGQRMNDVDTQRHTLLFHRLERGFGRICLFAFFDERRNLRVPCRSFFG